MPKNTTIGIEDAHIGFRNFSGKETKFNPPGRRNFCVFLDEPLAKILETDGWNVKRLVPKDPQDDPQPYLQVTVSFDNVPPKILMITSHGKNMLDAESIHVLDFADIKEVDLIINPYYWDVNGKTGIKAYVKSMYVTISEDQFEAKYFDAPDSCGACDGVCDSHCKEDAIAV
jgi:hypothetical protein